MKIHLNADQRNAVLDGFAKAEADRQYARELRAARILEWTLGAAVFGFAITLLCFWYVHI